MRLERNSLHVLLATAAFFLLGGCFNDKSNKVYSGEVFHATGMYSHQFPFSSVATCEAARRALLSQGYVVSDIKADIVNGQKSFQPDNDTHVEIAFHVVCVSDDSKGTSSTAFVNALQDRYAIKKTPSSASLGVGAVGAVSLPFGSSDDSLVKIASETIPPGPIYEQFFTLTGQYLEKIGADFGPEPKHQPSSSIVVAKPAPAEPKKDAATPHEVPAGDASKAPAVPEAAKGDAPAASPASPSPPVSVPSAASGATTPEGQGVPPAGAAAVPAAAPSAPPAAPAVSTPPAFEPGPAGTDRTAAPDAPEHRSSATIAS